MPATYEPIASTTLGSDAATIDFQSIPSIYTDLRLVISAQASSSSQNLTIVVNNDTGSNYSHTALYGTGSTAASERASNQTKIWGLGYFQPLPTATYWPVQVCDFMSYANASVFKTVLTSWANNQSTSGEVARFVSLWRSTSAINRITIGISSGNIKAGSSATLYGIKAA